MSISPSLKAAARSAYRSLYRASAITFQGDDRVLTGFRAVMRDEYIKGRSQIDPKLYEENVKLAREVAEMVRKNIVQGRRIKRSDESDEKDSWELRITEHTELGDNSTIKNPQPSTASNGQIRKAEDIDSTHSSPLDNNTVHRRLNYSLLKKVSKERQVPELREEDLEESFVRGSGPGGQSINKTRNNVQLLHKPTGIRVSCQDTRSLEQNRMFARRKIIQKLDEIYNPGLSKEEVKKARQLERERRRRKKAKKKAKQQMEAPEDLGENQDEREGST